MAEIDTLKVGLILCFDFPPKNSIGAQRPYSWFRYFKKFGIKPICITSDFNLKFVENKYMKFDIEDVIYSKFKPNLRDRLIDSKSVFLIGIRKFITFINQISQYFIFFGDNKREIYFESRSYLKANKVDFIIASGEPFILFRYASLLSKEFSIPWFADYRDDWIGNYMRVEKAGLLDKFSIKLEANFEKAFLMNVSGFTGVSSFLIDTIQKRIGVKNKKVIENGVDLSLFDGLSATQNEFSIVYTGILYDMPYIQIFANGFSKFLNESSNCEDVKVYFVGVKGGINQAIVELEKLSKLFPNNVFILDRVCQKDAAQFQLNASILLNLIAGDPSMGIIGAKCYNYAATRNPILSIPTIKNRKTLFFPNRNIQHLALTGDEVYSFIKDKYLNYKIGKSNITDITADEIYAISREYRAKELTDFIKSSI